MPMVLLTADGWGVPSVTTFCAPIELLRLGSMPCDVRGYHNQSLTPTRGIRPIIKLLFTEVVIPESRSPTIALPSFIVSAVNTPSGRRRWVAHFTRMTPCGC